MPKLTLENIEIKMSELPCSKGSQRHSSAGMFCGYARKVLSIQRFSLAWFFQRLFHGRKHFALSFGTRDYSF